MTCKWIWFLLVELSTAHRQERTLLQKGEPRSQQDLHSLHLKTALSWNASVTPHYRQLPHEEFMQLFPLARKREEACRMKPVLPFGNWRTCILSRDGIIPTLVHPFYQNEMYKWHPTIVLPWELKSSRCLVRIVAESMLSTSHAHWYQHSAFTREHNAAFKSSHFGSVTEVLVHTEICMMTFSNLPR